MNIEGFYVMVALTPISVDKRIATALLKTRCPHCGWPISARNDDRVKDAYYEHLVASHGAKALAR
ncbi:MAG TPA: hypothetical protein VM531_11185 [Sphingomicrobium sp.]|jgi:hypothetical protein|nr:hypothetical protein [Sphingomicrobium sp.]